LTIYPCYMGCDYIVRYNGTEYNIKYNAVGKNFGTNPDAIVLNEIMVNTESTSLTINVTVAKNDSGYMTLNIPRYLIDSKNSTGDTDFLAFHNDVELGYLRPGYPIGDIELFERTDVDEYEGGDSTKIRAFSTRIDGGEHIIEIIGTSIAPEFGFQFILPFLAVLIALALAAIRFIPISRFPPR